ncbi:hypothetical protein Y032_0009g602 [Ancylostoma ceylanicum]|uniref:Uncharacterized protein n=1 Tax=Ancylostoma ceylanicum TaxID=53326 RepID=A0A016VKE6_9BILA|nr:hypothetical protein Y032_0009g602 [Ancylostoma ceylanicum]
MTKKFSITYLRSLSKRPPLASIQASNLFRKFLRMRATISGEIRSPAIIRAVFSESNDSCLEEQTFCFKID